jgi:hypothetical protein
LQNEGIVSIFDQVGISCCAIGDKAGKIIGKNIGECGLSGSPSNRELREFLWMNWLITKRQRNEGIKWVNEKEHFRSL